MTTDETGERAEFLARIQADHDLFNRQQARRQRIALWSLIPYAAASGTAAVGIGYVLNRPDMRGTFALLTVGFVVIISLQWIAPEVTRRCIERLK